MEQQISKKKDKLSYNFKDLTNQIIGNFKVIKIDGRNKSGHIIWLCECLSCGNLTHLTSYELNNKLRKSCGCLTNKIISQKNTKHGLTHTRIYNIWAKLRGRCYRKTDNLYSYYGERGIIVCEEWNSSFMSFYNWSMENGYKDNLTIDRIDVNGNYEPNNCRWVNMKEQSNNKRNNIIIMYKGKEQTLKQWCEELKLNYKLVYSRIIYGGWSVERAFTEICTGKNSKQIFTYKGKTQNLSEWCREYNIAEKLVSRRIKEFHWSFEKALTTPSQYKGRRKINE